MYSEQEVIEKKWNEEKLLSSKALLSIVNLYTYILFIYKIQIKVGRGKVRQKVLRKFMQPCSHKHSHSLWVLINCFILVFSMYMLHYFHYFRKHPYMHVFICFGYYLYIFTKSREKTGGSASYVYMEHKECWANISYLCDTRASLVLNEFSFEIWAN